MGLEHYPAEGPALLVSNHVSFVDALMIGVVRARRVRFMMNREMYENPRFNWLWRIMGIIPISLHDGPKQIVESFKHARRAMDEGFVVCIFAEGAITRTGVPRAFRPGFERILKGSDYPVIPVYLGGLWGSILSHYYGAIRPRWPLGLPYPVTIVFGEPLPPTTTAVEVREAVTELSTRYYESLKPKRRPLGEDFVRVARRNWGRPAITDSTGRRLTYGQTLVSVLALRSLLRPSAETGEKVGILLPPSAGGALVNLALTLDRRIPVNLNYSAPAASVASAADQCGLRTTITSRAFVDRVPGLAVPGRQVFVEDLVDALSPGRKLFALLEALLVPPRALAGRASFSADDLLTVIFSSGSTGEPKGVMLSHHNLFSNIEALRMVLRVTPGDNICGVLPFFHSFGYTGTIWLPLVSGFGVSYHPNPMDVAGVGKCVADNGCTMLLGTPTFLMAYTRRVKPEAFRTLRFVMAGAEKLKPRIADAFEKRFGIRPLEGYGATELSPVAALNVPDVTVARVTQTGAKPGTVGHPLPGVAAKVVDPESGERLGPDQPGLLMIKGPNVMLGYLDRPGDTADVLRDGWYRTGDIAAIDVDGFITITDRLSRFSKIGGEMVPHIAVEEVLQKALKKAHQVLAVTSVPDEKKGERLVVIYTDEAGSEDDLRALVSASDLPNLWKPSAYARVGELPLLGSGKLDLGTLKDLAGAACRPRS
jgi:acyl-[acyl-carrier-protein]-phospholipid O-acyltransferase/long-chain-fatty-acid--[acyl-carrier-protein] ligase